MQINRELFIELLKESPAFRRHVSNVIFGEDLIIQVTEIVRNASGKIDAIKKVRELSRENTSEFRSAFPKLEIFSYADGSTTIGLSAAKNLVESIRSNW